MIYEYCPNCGKGDFHSVSGTFWSAWAHCKKCQHTYSVVDEWEKKGRPGKKQCEKENFNFSNLDLRETKMSNDVWLLPYGKTSVGNKALGSKYIGQVVNGRVVDHYSNVVGRVDLVGNFEPLRW